MSEETNTQEPEKKKRKPRKDTSFMLLLEGQDDSYKVVFFASSIKKCRKEAESKDDGKYVIASIRDSFTKSTTQTAVLKRG